MSTPTIRGQLGATVDYVRSQNLPGDLEEALCDLAARCPTSLRSVAHQIAVQTVAVEATAQRMTSAETLRERLGVVTALHRHARGIRDAILVLEVGEVATGAQGDMIEDYVKRHLGNAHLAAS